MRCRALLWLCFLSACTKVQVDQLDIAAAHPDYFFYAALDGERTPVRLSPLYGLEQGTLAFGGNPLFQLVDGEEDAAAILLTRDELSAVHEGFQPERAMELAVRLGTPEQIDPEHADVALPDSARVLVTSGSAPSLETLSRAIAISIPIDPEYCRGTHGNVLMPFGSSGKLLSPDVPVPEFEAPGSEPTDYARTIIRTARLDSERVLATSQVMMFVIHRGQPYAGPASRTDQWTRDGGYITSFAIAPNGQDVIVAGRDGVQPALFQLSLSGDQLTFVKTATVFPDAELSGARILDVAIDARGDTIAVGESGLVLFREHGTTPFVERPPVADRGYSYRRVIETGDPANPHLIAENNGRLFLGDVKSARWEVFERGDRFDNLRLGGLAAAPDRHEYWAVGPKGSIIVRREGPQEDWDVVSPALPPRFIPCSNPTPEGVPLLARTLTSVALDEQAAYLAMYDCNAILRLRRSDRCTSVMTLGDAPVATENFDLRTLSIEHGELYVGGSFGALYVAPSP